MSAATTAIPSASLWAGTAYFFRSKDGTSAWCLPQSIEDDAEPDNDDNPVEHLFQGKDDAYYARLSNGTTSWNLTLARRKVRS